MATIETRKTASGATSYRVKVRITGEKPRTRSFRRLTDAKAWAASVETDLGRGVYVPTTSDRRRTLADLIDKYVTECLPIKARNRDAAKVTTMLDWWREHEGFRTLDKLTPEAIAGAKATLAARRTVSGPRKGEPLSPATVNRYLAALSAVCKWAWRELRWLPSNPVLAVSKGSENKSAGRALRDDERRALIETCRQDADPNLYPAVLVALTTGMRYGNIRSLRWADVDLTAGVAEVAQDKAGNRRRVPLARQAVDALRAHLERDPTGEGWVFKGRSDRAPADIEKAWRRVKTAAGLVGERNLRFHDLRHSAASFLAANGATEAEIMAAIGWETPAMAARYVHLYGDRTRSVLQGMADKMLGGGS